MADKQDLGGLAGTLEQQSKLPLYGTTSEQMQELQRAQQEALSALEQRYAQPNWFKVAAGFAKPQLGGFLASLGSASEALGENVEQQRAQMLPIAQMRSQLAQTNLLLDKNKQVSDQIAKWRTEHPGQTPPANLIMEWQATAPHSPTVKALADQQTLAMQILRGQFESGAITRGQYADSLKLLQQGTQVLPALPKAPQDTTQTVSDTEKPQAKPEVTAPAELKPGEKYAIIHRYPTPQELVDKPQEVAAKIYEQRLQQAKTDESIAQKELDTYSPYMNPALYQPYVQSLTKTQNLLAKYSTEAAKVHDILGSGSLMSQIMKSIEKGGTISYGGLINGSASVSLPAKTWENAGLPRNLTSFANDLATEYMKQAALEARFGNANINKVPVAEFEAIMSAHPNLNQQWDAALNNTKHKLIDAWYNKKLGETLINDKKFVDKEELAPYFAVRQNSKKYQDLQRAWKKESTALQDEREKQLFPQ